MTPEQMERFEENLTQLDDVRDENMKLKMDVQDLQQALEREKAKTENYRLILVEHLGECGEKRRV